MSRLVLERAGYRLTLDPSGLRAVLESPAGEHWATLALVAALDRVDATDETLAVAPPRVDGDTVVLERRSTVWDRAGTTLLLGADELEVRTWVEGRGALGEAHLLGGRSLLPDSPTGFFPTGSSFRTLFTPAPADPGQILLRATSATVLGASGDGALGRGHWFSTPPPLFLALTTGDPDDPEDEVAGGWLGLGLAALVEELSFVEVAYRPGERAFHLVLDYEGHTRVEGSFAAPALVLTPGLPDPYTGLRRHRDGLAARGAAPEPVTRETPSWWEEPMFCGWGAQCHLARSEGARAPALATQERYDAFLGALEAEDVVPGTIVIDDKWQDGYGTNRPDREKWPDFRSWIAGRHDRGQHVLLWWKAWDPEGLPPELCVRTPDGVPIAVDPTNPAARATVGAAIGEMLSPDGLDADGLKVDFTGRTPGGRALVTHGRGWGIALLHELLAVVYAAAKAAKPDALVITHTPHPAFADVSDMLRLNDMLRLDDPGALPSVLPQMRYRTAVARAACPELLVDTDDWCVPDKASWREFLELKPELGVPSLYYATHIDRTGEALDADDYEALRRAWARWRARAPREAVEA